MIYTLDDPYIHMAIAKNLVGSGVWGISRWSFSSSSSSLLWTALIAASYLLFGVNSVSPIIFNILFAIATLAASYIILRRNGVKPWAVFFLLSVLTFLTPLPPLVFTGMEHTLYVFISLVFLYVSAGTLSNEKSGKKDLKWLLLLAPLVTLSRYEGLFLISIVCLLLLFKRKIFYSVTTGLAAAIPLSLFGLYSMSKGWFFLPNSVLLKGSMSSAGALVNFRNFLNSISDIPHLFLLAVLNALILIYFLYKKRAASSKRPYIMLIIFLASCFLHMFFIRTPSGAGMWFFRYYAYLIAMGIITSAVAINAYIKKPVASVAAALFVLLLAPAASEGISLTRIIPQETHNIYEQQYQMALFVKDFYKGQGVALNDIGFVSYLADPKVLDLVGLGNLDVLKSIRSFSFSTPEIYRISRENRVKIAMVSTPWFCDMGGLPPEWVEVASWTIPDNIVCAYPRVTFFAVDPKEEYNLIQNLTLFSTRLPDDIVQE